MKTVIGGKVYNTETATLIGSKSSPGGVSRNDFSYYEEELYMTNKGAFFLTGEGHAMTKYASNNGNTSEWGSGTSVLTRAQALTWCENADDVTPDELIKLFKLEEA